MTRRQRLARISAILNELSRLTLVERNPRQEAYCLKLEAELKQLSANEPSVCNEQGK
jgi:hypothetical protein